MKVAIACFLTCCGHNIKHFVNVNVSQEMSHGRRIDESYMADALSRLMVAGVRVLTYEGGPDTSCFFSNPSSIPGKLMANLDPRMARITYDYLAGHAAHGQHYGALNWFVCCATSYGSIFGQWGTCRSCSISPVLLVEHIFVECTLLPARF